MKKFQIGFLNNNLLNYLVLNYSKIVLLNTGIFNYSKKNFFYNIFYKRIIFPIKNLNGDVLGFSGRSLDNKLPKYINSYKTILFKKKNNLYGLWENMNFILKYNYVIFVEGYFDVLSLYQKNIKNALGLMGSYINNYHINLVIKFTKNIFICFDGDRAGKIAIKNSLIFFLNNYINLNIKYTILNNKFDPDEFIKKFGKKKFLKKINNSIDIYKLISNLYINNIFKIKNKIKKKIINFKNFYNKIVNFDIKKKILFLLCNNLKINLRHFFFIINNFFFKKNNNLFDNLKYYKKKFLIIIIIYPQMIFFFEKSILQKFVNNSKMNLLFLEILKTFDKNLNFINFFIKIKNYNFFITFKSLFKIFEKKKLINFLLIKNEYKIFIKKLSLNKKNIYKKKILYISNLFYNFIFKNKWDF